MVLLIACRKAFFLVFIVLGIEAQASALNYILGPTNLPRLASEL